MSTKTKKSADKILTAALDSISESTGQDLESALNVLSFLSAILASVRTDAGTRDRVLRADLDLIASLTPWISSRQAYEYPELPFIGYRSVFRDEDFVIDLDDLDSSSAERGGDANIDSVSWILKPFVYLPTDERARLLSAAVGQLKLELESRRDPWVLPRLALTLVQVTSFESWRSMPQGWTTQLDAAANALWAHACSVGLEFDFDDNEQVDFWLALCLLRDQGVVNPDAVRAVGLRGLFIGGWPMPVLTLIRGTVAHTILLAALNLESDLFEHRWSESQVDAMCEVADVLISDSDGYRWRDLSEGQVFPPARISAMSSDPVNDVRMNVAAFLLASLDYMGDKDFVSAVVGAVRDKQTLQRISEHLGAARRADGIDTSFDFADG